MPDIVHDFPVRAPALRVYDLFATPAGLEAWWTLHAEGTPALGEPYRLDFGPGYDWRARVTVCEPGRCFELEIVEAMDDWRGTRVGAQLAEQDGVTTVRFSHRGWPAASEHFRVSSFCWAMYLRLLRRYAETGERVPYERRLEV